MGIKVLSLNQRAFEFKNSLILAFSTLEAAAFLESSAGKYLVKICKKNLLFSRLLGEEKSYKIVHP